jgi:hypothetical protein
VVRDAGSAVAVAVTFLWLGMIGAISFLEAPLKFRAPGVTLRIGLGIGRVVFRALNIAEVVFGIAMLAVIAAGPPAPRVVVALTVAVAALAVQLAVVRPRLNRRTDKVLAGLDAPGSHAHYAYVGLEVAKAIALAIAGILLLSS